MLESLKSIRDIASNRVFELDSNQLVRIHTNGIDQIDQPLSSSDFV
jgi:hypothetical protein